MTLTLFALLCVVPLSYPPPGHLSRLTITWIPLLLITIDTFTGTQTEGDVSWEGINIVYVGSVYLFRATLNAIYKWCWTAPLRPLLFYVYNCSCLFENKERQLEVNSVSRGTKIATVTPLLALKIIRNHIVVLLIRPLEIFINYVSFCLLLPLKSSSSITLEVWSVADC